MSTEYVFSRLQLGLLEIREHRGTGRAEILYTRNILFEM